MSSQEKRRLAPYGTVGPGWEAVHTGEKSETVTESADKNGDAIEKWSTWAFTDEGKNWCDWDEEIRCINRMQEALGPLDDATRQIRAHIGSLVPCDSGVPVTIDELLGAISRGELSGPSFSNGCWSCGMWWQTKGTQPDHVESMKTVHEILTGYLAGTLEDAVIDRYPHARGFTSRAYEWLGPSSELAELKRLMLQRMLLPFEFFGKLSHATPEGWSDEGFQMHGEVYEDCFGENGRGARLDSKISEIAGLPEIPRLRYGLGGELVKTISDPQKRDLYGMCSRISTGVYELSDCHHNTFRVIENQIYGIATGKPQIPTRKSGAERERLARLLFSYALGIDKWLLGVPMQFLLLDLGHADLGFDPKSEIVKVYAYLGEERTLVREWLAACLWYSLYHNPHGGLQPLSGNWHTGHGAILEEARQSDISARGWMDSKLKSAD